MPEKYLSICRNPVYIITMSRSQNSLHATASETGIGLHVDMNNERSRSREIMAEHEIKINRKLRVRQVDMTNKLIIWFTC